MSDWNSRLDIFNQQAQVYLNGIKVDDFVHSTYCSFNKNYFYASTPKTACSTIKKVLINAEIDLNIEFEDSEYIHYREFNPFLSIRQVGPLNSYFQRVDIFKFCFVRNPYTRLLSCYLDKIKRNKFQIGKKEGKEIGFEEFVDHVCSQEINDMDQHWRTQYYQTFQKNILYDFIGRFENFEKDFKKILDALNIDIPKFYATERTHATVLKEFYTTEIQAKVFKKYRIDFESFEYSKELVT